MVGDTWGGDFVDRLEPLSCILALNGLRYRGIDSSFAFLLMRELVGTVMDEERVGYDGLDDDGEDIVCIFAGGR